MDIPGKIYPDLDWTSVTAELQVRTDRVRPRLELSLIAPLGKGGHGFHSLRKVLGSA